MAERIVTRADREAARLWRQNGAAAITGDNSQGELEPGRPGRGAIELGHLARRLACHGLVGENVADGLAALAGDIDDVVSYFDGADADAGLVAFLDVLRDVLLETATELSGSGDQ